MPARVARGTPSRKGVINLGRIGGFEISLDYSWFVIFFLILGTFSGAVFPASLPDLGNAAYLLMGAAGTFLFFASLLGHELAHSFVARSRGVPVEGITLFIFGGMARTKSEAESPGDEFVIAVVGPLASLAFAAFFQAVVAFTPGEGAGAMVVVVAHQLAIVNLALALFNLLPGFPLDGGRLLRAAVWKATGSLRRATLAASTAGRGLGFAIMGLGVLGIVLGNALIGGLWLIFIGWFLGNAASASYQHLLLTEVLRGVTARDAMSRQPEAVDPDVTVEQLVHDYFLRRPYNAFPVTRGGTLVGLVTLSQVKPVDRDTWPVTRVAEVMTPLEETVVVSPETPMTEVIQRIGESSSHRVMVAQDGRLEGIISSHDVAVWMDRARLLE